MAMTANHFGWLAGGLVLLAFATVCWSGRWRRWVRWEGPDYSRWIPITLLPGLGLLAVAYGISPLLPQAANGAVGGVGMLAALAGFVLMFWEPEWYGPRWFREVNKAFDEAGRADPDWLVGDARLPGESSAEATRRQQTSPRPLPPSERVRLIGETGGNVSDPTDRYGIILFYPQAPVFAVGATKDGPPVNRIFAAESLRRVRKLAPGTGLDGVVRRSGWRSWLVPRVRIDTGEGSWLFETRLSGRVAREVERRYLDPSAKTPRAQRNGSRLQINKGLVCPW